MKKNILQVVLLMTFLFLPLFVEDSVGEGTLYDIREYGAKGDGQTLNTNAINSAIEDCFRNGGVCPYGLYLGLQCFDGFLVCGYLPMQGGVLPLLLHLMD